jgi:hypothetical protein
LPVLGQLAELAELACGEGDRYLRYSRGPDADAEQASRDYESGLALPGLSVIALTPPSWWSRPVPDWVARQVCKYVHLARGEPDRYAWVLTGRMVGRGPDQEPLVADPRPLAVLSVAVLDQASQHYHERFDVGKDSRGS